MLNWLKRRKKRCSFKSAKSHHLPTVPVPKFAYRMKSTGSAAAPIKKMRPLPFAIFASRWLQLPLYIGLIVAQCVYVFHFWVELTHLIEAAFGSTQAVQLIASSVQPCDVAQMAAKIPPQVCPVVPTKLTETLIMLLVLGLIDVVMISNLLIMVIIGGYETFVSRMNLESHPDQPEWLSHVNASVLKVKLATAIIGISSIHLLKTFINAESYTEKTLIAQTTIHVVFLLSAMAIAATDRMMSHADHGTKNKMAAPTTISESNT